MRGFILLTALVFASLAPLDICAEEKDWEKDLLEELVNVKDGKMTIQEYGLLSFPATPNKKVQIRLYSEAPAKDVITRDNFVAITTMFQTMIFFSIAEKRRPAGQKQDLNDLFDFEELDAPIGKVDLEINFYMSKGGLQMEFVNTKENKTDRHTMTWKEVFKD